MRTYIKTAVPVGSKRVAGETDLGCSSATVRNVMSRMEGKGLLTQPHTSAGRIPTDAGYRVYVDELMEDVSLSRKDQEEVFFGVERVVSRPDQLTASLSSLLSTLTGLAGFAAPLRLDRGVLQSVYADRVQDGFITMVLTLESGLVRSTICMPEEEIDAKSFKIGVKELNDRFRGMTVEGVRDFLFGPEWEENVPPSRVMRLFRKAAGKLLDPGRMSDISISGLEQLLRQPEFRNTSDLASLAEFTESGHGFSHVFDTPLPEDRMGVWIGRENENEELYPFSISAGEYRLGRFSGVMGMIGPTRMEYDRVIPLGDLVRRTVGRGIDKEKWR